MDGNIFKVKITLGDKNIDTFSWAMQPEGSRKFFNALKKLIKLDVQDREALR